MRIEDVLKATDNNSDLIDLNPTKFYGLVDLIQSVSPTEQERISIFEAKLAETCEEIDTHVESLARANNSLISEVRNTTRKKRNPFASDDDEDMFSDLRHTAGGNNFMTVIFEVTAGIRRGFHLMRHTASGLKPGRLLIVGNRLEGGIPTSFEQLQAFNIQFEMNRGTINKFVDGILNAERVRGHVIGLGKHMVDILDRYHAALIHRHTVEGVQVFSDPVTTDIALSIYENVDSNGEIQDGKKPDEVSAYSIRKAIIVANAIKEGLVGTFIREPSELLSFITTNLTLLWTLSKELSVIAQPLAEKFRLHLPHVRKPRELSEQEFAQALVFIEDLDPRNVVFKDKAGMKTAEDKYALEFKNETLQGVVWRLRDTGTTSSDLINYVLQRKEELYRYYQDENSFYVCKIGNGNAFTGEAPGALTVVPGTKPTVEIKNILGSGFDQVREFTNQIRESAKWHDLFMATSPSKSADKGNALLIGPQGCGKSEVLRAVGGDRANVGIYAQPSDFLTCWKGEAERNPKRLFEASLKIQKESGKQVFILIDEVDTILNDDHARGGFGSTNLTTEFQQLMDGIVQYPHIAVWAATNHPERIPMPMIRRFSKVAVVGELDQGMRVNLLKHFNGFLPIADGFAEQGWQDAAQLLEGAVGDTIRKVADLVWREKMSALVRNHPEQAEMMVKLLNSKDQFSIARFKPADRDALMLLLRPLVSVKPEDVLEATKTLLDNVAIRAEIATAVETYKRSKLFLAGIKTRGGPEPKEEAQAEKVRPAQGTRVGAFVDRTSEGVVRFLGFGQYVGDEIPPREGGPSLTNMLYEAQRANPKIVLDNGDIVWGCECYWGPEDHMKAELMKASEVKEIRIGDIRKEGAN